MRRNKHVFTTLSSLGVDPNARFKNSIAKELIKRCAIKDLRNTMEGIAVSHGSFAVHLAAIS